MRGMGAGDGVQASAGLPRRHWLSAAVVPGAATGSAGDALAGAVAEVPPDYLGAWAVLVREIAVDPDWAAWWARSGMRVLDLHASAGPDGPHGPRVLRGRASVRVEAGVPGPARLAASQAAGAAPDGPLDTAAADLMSLLDLAGRALGLGVPPPLPDVVELPDVLHLPDGDPGGVADRRPRPATGYAEVPDATEDVVRTLVEVMGVPPEQARAIVGKRATV